MVAEAEAAGRIVEEAGLQMDRVDILFELDMHYLGQTHTVSVPLPVTVSNGTSGVTRQIVQEAFDAAYRAPQPPAAGLKAKIVNLRTAAIGRRPHFSLKALAPDAECSVDKAARGSRPVWFNGGWHDTAIYARLELPVGTEIEVRPFWNSLTPPSWSIRT